MGLFYALVAMTSVWVKSNLFNRRLACLTTKQIALRLSLQQQVRRLMRLTLFARATPPLWASCQCNYTTKEVFKKYSFKCYKPLPTITVSITTLKMVMVFSSGFLKAAFTIFVVFSIRKMLS